MIRKPDPKNSPHHFSLENLKSSFKAAVDILTEVERVLPFVPHFDETYDVDKIVEELLDYITMREGHYGYKSFREGAYWREIVYSRLNDIVLTEWEHRGNLSHLSPEEALLRAIFGPPHTEEE